MVENSTQKAPHAGNDDNSSTKPYSEAFFLGFNNPTPGLEAEHSSTSPAPENSETHNRKRNRILFVCQACRKSKTKCDREKPECGRCVKHGLKCVYDVSKQPAPRIPSKDAIISRLEKDMFYWKDKAMKLLTEREVNESGKRSASPINTNNASGDSPDTKKQHKMEPIYEQSGNGDINNGTRNDIEINLYRSHPTMIMSKVMKREVKPLSENYIIIQDCFLKILVTSVFLDTSKNTMIPALTANANITRAQPSVANNLLKLKEMLIRQCQTEDEKNRVNEFTDRILQNTNSNRNLKIGMLLSMLYNSVGYQYLEDHCPQGGEYSDLLRNLINECEAILPSYEIIERYKNHFYEYVYPSLPFIELEIFEESLSQTIFPDPNNPSKVQIRMGSTHLRAKVENLSLLLVILKLSYMSIRFLDHSTADSSFYLSKEIIDKYPIPNDFILLSQRCLASENWCACANENIISCLLYIWSFFAFSPEEGDFFLEHPTDVISSLIMMLSTSIGLHRDPSDFPQLISPSTSDKRTLNHRRILWLSIVTVCSFEASLKGRHSVSPISLMALFLNIKDPDSLTVYMNRVRGDLSDINNHKLLRIHKFTFKRAQLALLLSDLDNLTMTYYGSFHLHSIEFIREKIEIFVEENFPIVPLKSVAQDKSDLDDMNVISEMNILSSENSSSFHNRIMNKLLMLRTSMAVFLHFETLITKDKSIFPFYKKYFMVSCMDALSLINYFNKFFNGEYRHAISSLTSFNVTKFIQLALSSTIFSLLGIILRIGLAIHMLSSEVQKLSGTTDPRIKELNTKVEKFSTLQRDLESALEGIYCSASEHLRFTYFPVFKMLALFDVIVQRMRKGELWHGIFTMIQMEQMHSRIIKTLSITLGVKLDKKDRLLEELMACNHVANFSVEDIDELNRNIKKEIQISSGLKPPVNTIDLTNGEPFGNAVPTFTKTWSSSLDNLEKLSSAAAVGQSLDYNSGLRQGPLAGGGSKEQTPIAGMNNLNNSINATPIVDNSSGSQLPNGFDRGQANNTPFPGYFGGLDLFDYDFLFGNDFA
ncbi:oleate-activated transcription factor OAF1 [Saccharomyces cerevisiae S288C]|uniref:Oleate-activated transcription factor 1 n=1 Tax=Saccharomyces cerevisiae (strain ATCC 204508 / S288c) TaxID=559292 RepID=OAF1_YEAST|eukprot:NP_009349.3 oleate-activated transcription factor OAF1 [Saccharomyces cerevisiae S288C]